MTRSTLLLCSLLVTVLAQVSQASGNADPGRETQDNHKETTWILFPGIWRSNDRHEDGVEISLLYKGVGGAFGLGRGGGRYAEAEVSIWLLALGAGLRQDERYGNGWQVTWSLPLLPLFPYGRWITTAHGRGDEYGLMLKFPAWHWYK